jgi:hypothetical protein
MVGIVELPLKVLGSLWEVARNTPLPVLLLLLVGLVAIGLAFVGLPLIIRMIHLAHCTKAN